MVQFPPKNSLLHIGVFEEIMQAGASPLETDQRVVVEVERDGLSDVPESLPVVVEEVQDIDPPRSTHVW